MADKELENCADKLQRVGLGKKEENRLHNRDKHTVMSNKTCNLLTLMPKLKIIFVVASKICYLADRLFEMRGLWMVLTMFSAHFFKTNIGLDLDK